MDFVCPKCHGVLTAVGNSKICPAGHSFDRARAGYYNLLLGSSAGTHGDNREMVEARRRFLSAGHYLPLAERLSELAAECVSDGVTVIDCGCGEGYYTAKIFGVLDGKRDGVSLLAFDISRDAVKLAARAYPAASYAVASCYSIPVPDGSIDLALNVFSPLAPAEMRRALRKNGRYIIAYPDRLHLFDLKAAIYDKPYENQPQGGAPDGFSLVKRESIAYSITLSSPEVIRDLFAMTPYAYRTGKTERERLEKLEKLDTRVEFLIDIYEKTAD